MDPDDLTSSSAAQIAARVHDGWSSAVDVARAHLARIEAHDAHVGAFEVVDPRRVLAEAEGVDSRADRFALPLAGVPVAVKDCVDVAGYPTRHGSAATSTEPARRDDDLVKRLRAAGAIVVGKTRMPELAIWGFTHSELGTTRNPLDGSSDPGGSSGGSAAAVAAGMAALALGTDGGGSIRIPAAYCGLVGMKPGDGVVPLPGRLTEHWNGLTAVGPLARTAQDAAIMLGVLSGAPVVLGDRGPSRIVLSLRVPSPIGRLHPDHRAAAVGAAARLRTGPGGATVVLDDPPYPRGLATQWMRRWHSGVAQDLAALGLDPDDVEPRTASVARRGRRARPGVHAGRAWRDRMVAWLDDGGYDLMIGPAVAGPAPRAGSLHGRGYTRTLLEQTRQVPFTQAWNLAGLPAMVAPVVIGGRAVGVQLVGRPGSEAALLTAAARLERQVVPMAGAAAPRIYA
ncbi:amidase [Pseudonocardia abyssalis]|uniref:Amidase n=1 Tax=Pseudonocardia abyssalis TaxID=2792008 RepID=A0ABS6UV99_9PSEU|nr:amidase family protein [Pseudonocardia abyssalis]MBW0115774.1 amidase [Pseudonocardia abyssalis]MBW0136190.1 amidase [Pseudonocardia abyssalis]